MPGDDKKTTYLRVIAEQTAMIIALEQENTLLKERLLELINKIEDRLEANSYRLKRPS